MTMAFAFSVLAEIVQCAIQEKIPLGHGDKLHRDISAKSTSEGPRQFGLPGHIFCFPQKDSREELFRVRKFRRPAQLKGCSKTSPAGTEAFAAPKLAIKAKADVAAPLSSVTGASLFEDGADVMRPWYMPGVKAR